MDYSTIKFEVQHKLAVKPGQKVIIGQLLVSLEALLTTADLRGFCTLSGNTCLD